MSLYKVTATTTNMILVSLLIIISSQIGASSADLALRFDQSFNPIFGNMQIGPNLNLILNKGDKMAGVNSKSQFIHCRLDIQIKLPVNSAGTNTAFYIGTKSDEINFSFVRNGAGQPYTLQTNVMSQGNSYRVMRFKLWFDPAKDFNTYSIFWNRKSIVFYVNDVPIRIFNSMESSGVHYPKQAARIFATLTDDSVMQGGPVKPDWSKAPFTASFRNLKFRNVCFWLNQKSSCDAPQTPVSSDRAWLDQRLDTPGLKQIINGIQKKFLTYSYCTDRSKYLRGFPPECRAL